MAVLLAVFAILLLIGSLYPWHFRPGLPLSDAAWLAWILPMRWHGLRDFVVNISIYVPIGFTGYLWRGWGGRAVRVAATMLLGLSLSFLAETLQTYFPPRTPSRLDLLLNTTSTAMGIVLAVIFDRTLKTEWMEWRRRHALHLSSALFLLLLWGAVQTWPDRLFPTAIVPRLRALAHPGAWSPEATLAGAAPWLLLAALLIPLVEKHRARLGLLLLLPVYLVCNLIVPGHQLTWSHIAGAVVAVAALSALPWQFRRASLGLAALWLGILVLDGLRPYRLLDSPSRFSWIPFEDMLDAPWLSSIAVLLRKTWIYGGAFWLLVQTRLRHRNALIVLVVLLIVIEAVQRWLPARGPGLTDPSIALLAIALVSLIDQRFQSTMHSFETHSDSRE